MFQIQNFFPEKYQDCFEQPSQLKGYLLQKEFLDSLDLLLYNCDNSFFHIHPDARTDFLLYYQNSLRGALSRFEERGVPLDQYILCLLSRYRKNFFKQRRKHEFALEKEPFFEDAHPTPPAPENWRQPHKEPLKKLLWNLETEVEEMKQEDGRIAIKPRDLLYILLIQAAEHIDETLLQELVAELPSLDLATLNEKLKQARACLHKRVLEKQSLETHARNYYSRLLSVEKEYQNKYLDREEGLQEQEEHMQALRQKLSKVAERYKRYQVSLPQRDIARITGIEVRTYGMYRKYLQKIARKILSHEEQ